MLKLIKNLSTTSKILIAIITTVVIAILSLMKLGEQPISFVYIDKVQHIIAYAALTLVWLLALVSANKLNKLIVLLLCFIYGIIIEILQATLTSYRAFEFYDIIADLIGVLLGLVIYNYFFSKK